MKSGRHSMTWDAKDSDGWSLLSSICTARLTVLSAGQDRLLVPSAAGVTPEYAESIKVVLVK